VGFGVSALKVTIKIPRLITGMGRYAEVGSGRIKAFGVSNTRMRVGVGLGSDGYGINRYMFGSRGRGIV
jgi:hypothetical protein